MRAILLLLLVGAGACGSNDGDTFELDVAVDAPQATSVLVDGTKTLPPTGGIYSQGFTSESAAASLMGTIETIAADGSVRASATYMLGTYCDTDKPLLRQTLSFSEGLDGSGNPMLTLSTVECEKTDGTGTIITP